MSGRNLKQQLPVLVRASALSELSKAEQMSDNIDICCAKKKKHTHHVPRFSACRKHVAMQSIHLCVSKCAVKP